MMRRWRETAIGLGLCAVACAGGPGAAEVEPLPAFTPALVDAAPAAPRPATEELLAVLVPRSTATITSPLAGLVLDVRPEVGDRVAAGSPIVVLDQRSLAASLRARRSEAAATQALVDEARGTAARAGEQLRAEEVLAEREATTREALRSARTAHTNALARLHEAQARATVAVARVDEARVLAENATIVAPFDGVIAGRSVSAGATVRPGEPLLRMHSDDAWILRVAFPEGEGPPLAEGEGLSFWFDEVLCRASMRAEVPLSRHLGVRVVEADVDSDACPARLHGGGAPRVIVPPARSLAAGSG